jgi:hypothetical protein
MLIAVSACSPKKENKNLIAPERWSLEVSALRERASTKKSE